ncbi:SDR family NAD(P)-dependent oxidoreductase [Pseudofrankia asymbiotica]|uniref:Short-chain dehydrogenase n=1 Tax=Pseudofrankia asymbiotica TaxID=1834516 RepID=A0A1V2I9M8_9ACTN|nr:SDR family NAD(P)-dependent oxidoreductase [Pseudofrankia asymbiotica]ONH28003.1 short-chain dehydrogenase [Pseudofrankia asymbiotica]
MKLEAGQVAVVTGAASGIGLAMAVAFARRGLHVVLTDVRADALDAARETLPRGDAGVLTRAADVRRAEEVDALASATLAEFGRVDVICNNAGVVGPPAPMWEQSLDVWRWVVDVSLFGVIHGVRAFVPHLVRQGHGHVLNTASVGGLAPLPTLAPYNAAKHGVIGLSETLRAELDAAGVAVGVTVVCPGLVATGIRDNSVASRPGGVGRWAVGGRELDDATRDAPVVRPGTVLAAADVARLALEGIEQDRLHVLTHPDSGAVVQARLRAVAEAVTAVTSPPTDAG